MKIRNGFVSNSSTSSFLIYGVFVEGFSYDDCDQIMKNTNGFSYYCPEGCDGAYIGISWSDITDDETGKQFKERIEKQLRELFKDKGVFLS